MTTPSSLRTIVDQFAGAGGWEEGLAQLGYRAIGIEIDPVACQTAEAAGHRRVLADVAETDPWAFGPIWGVIASSPCGGWSLAGKGEARADKPHVIACARDLAAGNDTRSEHLKRCRDSRSLLAVEPLRWAVTARPEWIALEQVPTVRELWDLFADLLAAHGYYCATGVLSAEQYGVPQTRKRAFLIANRLGPVTLPAPTHKSFYGRHPTRSPEAERHLLPWVSMAEALDIDTNAMTYTICQTNGGRRPRGLVRGANRPARTLDTMSYAWQIEPGRPEHRPRRPSCEQRTDLPAWASHRPATTVCCDPRVHPPGHRRNAADPPGRYLSRAGRSAVRVTVEQASILQGFRPDYPWQGARYRQFRQIGNAVCPPLARRVLAEAMRPSLEQT